MFHVKIESWRFSFSPIFPPLSDDIGEIYPISRIVQEVKDQQDYGTALSQETYYQVSLIPRLSPSLSLAMLQTMEARRGSGDTRAEL